MVPLQIFYKRITILVSVTCLMIGCRSNRNVEIPDAPPPYANFPAPQNFQNPQPVAAQPHGNLFADSYNPAPPTQIIAILGAMHRLLQFLKAGMFSERKPISGH